MYIEINDCVIIEVNDMRESLSPIEGDNEKIINRNLSWRYLVR